MEDVISEHQLSDGTDFPPTDWDGEGHPENFELESEGKEADTRECFFRCSAFSSVALLLLGGPRGSCSEPFVKATAVGHSSAV